MLFLYKSKGLDSGKQFKNKLRTKPGLFLEHKNKVFRLAILEIRTEPGYQLYCTACRLVLFSHFSLAKVFSDHILFEEYRPLLSMIFNWLYWKGALKQISFSF